MVLKESPSCNIVHALRNRSTHFSSFNRESDGLYCFVESCAATQCRTNKEANLPTRSKSTFMTAFSPNCELIASCHGDHNVYVTNIQTCKVVKTLVGHERSPWCISFHPTSNDILATGCLNGEVRVWDLRGGGSESWTNQSADQATITSLSFHPIDHILLIGSGNGIYLWDWKLPAPFASIKTSSPFEKVRFVRFEAHGSRILTGISNSEEETMNREAEEEEDNDDLVQVSAPPQSTGANDFLDDLYLNTTPSVPSRTFSARPLTASFNLRGRHARVTPSNELLPGSSDTVPRAFLRQDANDHSVSHTYSRDHGRILRARVSVQEEIQHQYNRLQQLRMERRRLEDRLRQLQNNQASLRSSRRRTTEEDRRLRSHGGNSLPYVYYPRNDSTNGGSSFGIALPLPLPGLIPTQADLARLSSTRRSLYSFVGAEEPVEIVDPALALFGPSQLFNGSVDSLDAGYPPHDHSNLRSYRRARRFTSNRRSYIRQRSFFRNLWPFSELPPNTADKATYRLQWWNFSDLRLPEIGRSDVNVVVRYCKIYNDSSVDVSKDGHRLAAIIWPDCAPQDIEVGVFSLHPSSLGCLMYRHTFDSSQYAVCLSFSPLANYLAVGLKYLPLYGFDFYGQRRTVAQILKLGTLGCGCIPVLKVKHPRRDSSVGNPVNINTISWLPHVGQGLVYGTNNGQLRFCFTKSVSH